MSPIPGSPFRRILFWCHLACGVGAGLLILVMSATGVLLAYEHQMVERAARANEVMPAAGATRLPADQLAARAQALAPPGVNVSLVFDALLVGPVQVNAGRETVALLDPFTGAAIHDASAGLRDFFGIVERLHRRLGADSRSTTASLLDIANLVFLFIIASGIYLWLPAVWRWRTLRGLVLFRSKYVNGKVRDFNWHHVFSVWALLPLLLIAFSGVVMSYPWANRLVFAAFGEEPPQRAATPPAAGDARAPRIDAAPGGMKASLQQLLDVAATQEPRWRRITLPAKPRGSRIDVTIELQSTERRAPRRTVTLSAADASVLAAPPAQATVQTPGQRARSWLRFVHTGEQYGIAGQTIAGLASLAACLLVYTGLALAWRRLVVPVYRRD